MFVHELLGAFGPQAVLLVGVGVASLLLAWSLRKAPPGPLGSHVPAVVLTLGSGLAIAIATLTRRGEAYRAEFVQLTPFATIEGYVRDADPRTSVIVFVLGNVALFVPFAFFLYLAVRRSVVLTTLAAASVSVGVEILQLPIWSRTTDVDDVITNSLGGLIGAVLATIVYRLPGMPAVLVPRRGAPDQPADPAGSAGSADPASRAVPVRPEVRR